MALGTTTMIKWLRAFFYYGRHNMPHSDMSPAGAVWYHGGEWWTFTRRELGRVPREFDLRSNPLDHDEYVAETWKECKERRRYAEVEY